MISEKLFLQLLSDDLRSLHASALALEDNLRRLSLEVDSHDVDSLAGLIAQINCAGFAPIEAMLREAGVSPDVRAEGSPAVLSGVLGEAKLNARRAETRRIGAASAISIMRRSARYMEMYCSSIADSAMQLRLTELAGHLRALGAGVDRPRVEP